MPDFNLTIYPRFVSTNPQAGLPILILGDANFDAYMAWPQKNIAVGVKKTGAMGPYLPAPYTPSTAGANNRPAIFAQAPPIAFFLADVSSGQKEMFEGGISSITVTVTITNLDDLQSKTGSGALDVGFGNA